MLLTLITKHLRSGSAVCDESLVLLSAILRQRLAHRDRLVLLTALKLIVMAIDRNS